MFGIKKAPLFPAGPHEFEAEVVIERPASEVYPLIDFADPRHAKRQLGESVEALGGEPPRYALIVSQLPDAVFTLTITHEARDREYGFACEASVKFGRVAQSHELYVLHEEGPERCRLVLTQTVTFDAPLSEQAYAREAMMLSMASVTALSKIKLHAEDGVEALRKMG